MIHHALEVLYLKFQSTFERFFLSLQRRRSVGPLKLDADVHAVFMRAPWDILPGFQGPASRKLRLGRGMDHPRYGRFIYALAKVYRPQVVVELGSYAGGTAIGWATALKENGSGRLISVDNDTYSQGTYPTITQANVARTGLDPSRYEFRPGDSRQVIPRIAREMPGGVDIYLVDADHTYDGAMADMQNGLPMVKPGGFILVHDVDPNFRLLERTPEHRQPVYDALMDFVAQHRLRWCRLKFIRRHLAVVQV